MIEPHWKRICGIHFESDGKMGAVWLAFDHQNSVAHLYDCAIFNNVARPVIIDGLTARGRFFPVCWAKKDEAFAEDFLDHGVYMHPEPCEDDQTSAEVVNRELGLMLEGSRLRVERRLHQWRQERKSFHRVELHIPLTGFPLMSATRHAIEKLDDAISEADGMKDSKKSTFPKLAIV